MKRREPNKAFVAADERCSIPKRCIAQHSLGADSKDKKANVSTHAQGIPLN